MKVPQEMWHSPHTAGILYLTAMQNAVYSALEDHVDDVWNAHLYLSLLSYAILSFPTLTPTISPHNADI
jgi:hypothetical protein